MEDEAYDLTGWWVRVEGICNRAGKLKKKLDKDRERVLRRMETMRIDELISDGQTGGTWQYHGLGLTNYVTRQVKI